MVGLSIQTALGPMDGVSSITNWGQLMSAAMPWRMFKAAHVQSPV